MRARTGGSEEPRRSPASRSPHSGTKRGTSKPPQPTLFVPKKIPRRSEQSEKPWMMNINESQSGNSFASGRAWQDRARFAAFERLDAAVDLRRAA